MVLGVGIELLHHGTDLVNEGIQRVQVRLAARVGIVESKRRVFQLLKVRARVGNVGVGLRVVRLKNGLQQVGPHKGNGTLALPGVIYSLERRVIEIVQGAAHAVNHDDGHDARDDHQRDDQHVGQDHPGCDLHVFEHKSYSPSLTNVSFAVSVPIRPFLSPASYVRRTETTPEVRTV